MIRKLHLYIWTVELKSSWRRHALLEYWIFFLLWLNQGGALIRLETNKSFLKLRNSCNCVWNFVDILTNLFVFILQIANLHKQSNFLFLHLKKQPHKFVKRTSVLIGFTVWIGVSSTTRSTTSLSRINIIKKKTNTESSCVLFLQPR